MHQSLFSKLFPPPKYMDTGFAGLEISDDALRCLQYKSTVHGRELLKFDEVSMPTGVIQGGDIRDEKVLKEMLAAFVEKNKLSYVSVSIPEEKAYLFLTDVVGVNIEDIAQNIEFKLEENVPLSTKDAIYYFDLISIGAMGGVLVASVSVASKVYIEKQVELLAGVGLVPVSFEVVPKSIARVALDNQLNKTSIVIHFMNEKIGIYIVSGGVVCFTSTVASSSVISNEIKHTIDYWKSKTETKISEIILSGKNSRKFETGLVDSVPLENCPVKVANTWRNAIDVDKHIPSLSMDESMDYIVVAGLALDN